MSQRKYDASHAEFGQLVIEQEQKSAGEAKAFFRLHLKTHEGRNVSFTQEMTAEDVNPVYTNRSTFGYDVVDLPESMQGKSIGYFVQYAAARAAMQLGAQRVTVDAVSNERMKALCTNVGMTNREAIVDSCYSGNPREVAKRSLAKMKAHGWSISSD